MGNNVASTPEKTDEMIQKHIFAMHSFNYNDILNSNHVYVTQLTETHFFEVESTRMKVTQKLFLKKEDENRMKQIDENLRHFSDKISLLNYPYFLLSKNVTLKSSAGQPSIPALCRQKLHLTLEEKLIGGITLAFQEKINLALQIIIAGLLLHDAKLFHANLSSSNIVLTSDSVVYFTDFAPYKPLYLNESKLDEVKLFFPDIKRCYLAPEKMDANKSVNTYLYSMLKPEELEQIQLMDVFSIGCILSEIFTDNNPLFTYESMLSYKGGNKSVLQKLETISNEPVKQMIIKMLSIDPQERGTLQDAIAALTNVVPPDMLSLYGYLNYALRRGEFSQPDVKLGLIRMLAPKFIDSIKANISSDVAEQMATELNDLVFRRCFPYHISKESLLAMLKIIINSSPLKSFSFFPPEPLIKFLDDSQSKIERTDLRISSSDKDNYAISLDGVRYLKEANLDIQREAYTEVDPFKDTDDLDTGDERQTFEKILQDAKQSFIISKHLARFTPISHIIETICSLLRNLQISQSYLVALELLEVFSLFVTSEQTIFLIFPHLQKKVGRERNILEVYYACNLLCKLTGRIKYVSKILAKTTSYAGYIKPLIELFKTEPYLKNHIFRNIHKFIYLSMIFSVINQQIKREETLGKSDPDFVLETANVPKVVNDILTDINNTMFKNHFDYPFFSDLISKNYKSDIGAIELVKTFPKIYHFFDPPLRAKLIGKTFEIYSKKAEIGFKTQALYTVGCIVPSLSIEVTKETVNKMKYLLTGSSDPTELASILKSFASILQYSKLDYVDKCIILSVCKGYLVHPCKIVNANALNLVKIMYDLTPKEDICQILAPILSAFSKKIQALDFETFELVRVRPLSYLEYDKIEVSNSKDKDMNMTEAMILFVSYIERKVTPKGELGKSIRTSLRPREFKETRNIGNYIQEVLGSVILYEMLESDDKLRKELEKELEKDSTKDKLIDFIMKKLYEADDKLKVFPVWENATTNYEALSEFKQKYVDTIGMVRGSYKFLKQFNNAVVKICMNYLQMIIYQTRLNFVAENRTEIREDLDRLKKWRPLGILLTSINSHEGVVKCLAPLGDSVFASGAHDGFVKYHSLPAINKNFLHSSVHDVDLNKGRDQSEPMLQVNQLHYLKHVKKLAVITNSKDIIVCQESKPDLQIKLQSKARITAATIYDQDEYRNCIACVNTDCQFLLWDLRQKNPAIEFSFSKIRGVPSAICRLEKDSTNMISTYKGYILCHDIRSNTTMSTSRLTYEKKLVPVVSISQFNPLTSFKNFNDSSERQFITVTYPSKCNQFSVFTVPGNIHRNFNPKIHFESRTETKTSKPIEFPMLECVTSKEVVLNYDYVCDERFDYLNQLYLSQQNTFSLGKSFHLRSVKSIAGLYTDNFHLTKLAIKKECLKNFADVLQTQSSMGENNMTVNKVLSIPSSDVPMGTQMDNIFLTAGTDRNIRFMSLGNELEKIQSFGEEYESYNCYHLSNMDNQTRNFKYVYSRDTCILKESIGSSDSQQFTLSDAQSQSQVSMRNPRNGLSYYHNTFLSQRKTSDTLPGHSAAINDIITLEHKEGLFIISCGDDNSIKVWL